MKLTLLSTIVVAGLGIGGSDEFQPPTRLMADGVPVRVENPGWACPCWADMDGDGKKDLLVGQFNGGKIRVYRNLGDGKLAAGDWLKADGAVAEIPGVW
jgi:FG-GAP-like repeat